MADAGDVRRMERILDRVRGYGVVVRELPDWRRRGRTFERVPCGIVDHHDASTRKAGEWGALGAIAYGFAGGPPAPLSQFQIARCLDGVPKLAVVAAGRANHAGRGGPRNLGGCVVAENAGNGRLYGAEKANDGRGEPYTPAAHYASDALFAAVLEECRGAGVGRLIGHKEWANDGRKADPEYPMQWRRDRVAVFPPAPPADTGGEDVGGPVVVRGSGAEVFLSDLGTYKRWIRSGVTVELLKRDGFPVVVGSHYDAVLAPLPQGEDIP